MKAFKQINLIEQKLRTKEKSLGWLSLRTKISKRHLYKIKNNSVIPKVPTGQKIARALDCLVEEVFIYPEED